MKNKFPIRTLAATAALVIAGLAARGPARAQDAAKDAPRQGSIAAIDVLYQKELDDVERKRLERLAALAGTQAKDEANRTYETYLRAAIASNLFADAEPVAERVLRAKGSSAQVTLLAHVVHIMAQAGRGAYDESLASLASALDVADRARDADGAPAPLALPVSARLSLLDAYFQRLTQGDQFAVAKKAFAQVRDRTADPTVKAFAAARLARLDMVGKPAPPIAGTDVDGRPVRLADFRGDAVLVVFWASWCLKSAEEVARLEAVSAAYRDRGFRIIGVNLDSLQDVGKSPDSVRPAVRQFLLEYNVPWPNLINAAGEQDYAQSYAVAEIPANVLIGRDGNVAQLDLTAANLEKVVARAVGR